MDTERPALQLPAVSPVVELNVGGTLFTTTLATLRKYPGSRLAELASGPPGAQTDRKGRLFIDRPGAPFGPILEFLRSGRLPSEAVPDVYREARYYALEPLVKLLEEAPPMFGDRVARRQFLLRVPGYGESLELMIRIARAEAVAARASAVVVCALRTEEDAARCLDALGSLEAARRSVVKFGPWKASPAVGDLLDCIRMDVEARGYRVSYQPYVAERGFRGKFADCFFRFVFTWW
ncbi:BTB/POZ domain-containing protein KCTD14 [Tachyglossus aculeatus]|uniref:BTB/POZ domain-containing protein KCTD14 n=1 Tax=Tachyglossus aculeatus TaxID=9261 RepID=UPI0018F2C624|nr:BTB/POZ domain-containing protein KCTD14 [Tachyglossus aculeatus]